MTDLRRDFDRMLRQMLSEYLSAAGFSLKGHTFSRRQANHIEHFNFQGSQGNRPDYECRYYLNCGVEFPEIPPSWMERVGRPYLSGGAFARHIAWSERAEHLVKGAPWQWTITAQTDLDRLRADIIAVIEAASPALVARATKMRRELWLLIVAGRVVGLFKARSAKSQR